MQTINFLLEKEIYNIANLFLRLFLSNNISEFVSSKEKSGDNGSYLALIWQNCIK